MNLKPAKSRSLVMVKGRLMDVQPFKVGDVEIPSIQRKPVKALGRTIDATLSDKVRKDELEEMINEDIKALKKSDLTGVMKVWAYEFMMLPRMGWRLMLYEIPMTWVERVEAKINSQLRMWLGISKNTTDVALFCPESPCALPLRSLSKEFKKIKTNATMQLIQSADESVSQNFKVNTSRKWKVSDAIGRAEGRIQMMKITGQTQSSRAGFGLFKKEEVPRPSTQAYRKAVTQLVGKEEDEKHFIKAVQQGVQGSWTKWQKIIRRDMSWNSMLTKSPRLINFALSHNIAQSINYINNSKLTTETERHPVCT